jgi:hypothetical protein
MPKVDPNALISALRGSVGGLVFRQMRNGSVVVSRAPDFSRRKFSKGQKEHQQRFREASAYARHAAKTQPVYAELAQKTMRTAYNIALSDWFNPPVIHRIERKEGRILVEASDNVMVTKVQVSVFDAEGTVLEKGEAVREKGDLWAFVSHVEGHTIAAEAWDPAGNLRKFVLS